MLKNDLKSGTARNCLQTALFVLSQSGALQRIVDSGKYIAPTWCVLTGAVRDAENGGSARVCQPKMAVQTAAHALLVRGTCVYSIFTLPWQLIPSLRVSHRERESIILPIPCVLFRCHPIIGLRCIFDVPFITLVKMPLGIQRINAKKSHPNDRIIFIKPLKGPDEKIAQDFLERIAAQCGPLNHPLFSPTTTC